MRARSLRIAPVLLIVLSAITAAQTADFEHALSLFQQKRWPEAASAFAGVEVSAPGISDALLYRGKALINLGQFAEATLALQSYRQKHPTSEDAAFLLAYVLFRQNKPKDSLDMYTLAAKLKTPSADDLKIVALNYVLLTDYADAARYLEMAVQMEPGNIEAHYHLGRVFYQQNRFDQAAAEFQKAVTLDPRNAKAQNNLGLTLEAKNQVEPAIAAYRKAVELDRASAVHSEHPYINLANLLEQSNRAGEAVSLLDTAVELNAKSARAHYLLGKAYFAVDRVPDSQKEVEAAIGLDAQDPSLHYLLGRIYRKLRKVELANREFALTDEMIKAQRAHSNGMGAMESPQRKEMPQE